jgi:hypothetical protein
VHAGQNLTSNYTYDPDNRLIMAGSATLIHDPSNRLYEVVGGSTMRLVYDGAAMIAEDAHRAMYCAVHGPSIDEPLVWFEGGHSRSCTPDRCYLFVDERRSVIGVEGSSTTNNGANGGGEIRTCGPGRGNGPRLDGFEPETSLRSEAARRLPRATGLGLLLSSKTLQRCAAVSSAMACVRSP